MGVELTDVFIALKPREKWSRARAQADLTALVQRELRDMPGQRFVMTQPIEMRMNEMVSGARGDVAVKLFGDDFDVLVAKSREIEGVLRSVPGCVDPSTEQITGQPVLQIRVKPDAIARYGVSAKTVLDLVESIGSKPVGEVVEGEMRFPLVVRLPENLRASPEAIGAIVVSTPSGERIPLSRLASVETTEGPSTITREWGRRRITISCNVRGRDVGSFVAEARSRIAERVQLPPGRYFLEWGGQFENLERAQTRLMIVVPVALALIFVLLHMSLGSMRLALLVFTGVPLAVTGGVTALWVREMPFSISAGVGFIALSGVAVLNGLVMLTFIRQLRARGAGLEESVVEGSLTRLRPVLMTALVAALGFVPMALADGMGAEVQRPLATVVIGGIVSSTLLTLVVLPVLYGWFEPRTSSDADGVRVPSGELP
jgi:cobalt-zinc-cadmium resistance protein CzcA